MIRKRLWVAQADVDRLSIVLGVQDKGGCERLLAEELDELCALKRHFRELPRELVFDHLLHPA